MVLLPPGYSRLTNVNVEHLYVLLCFVFLSVFYIFVVMNFLNDRKCNFVFTKNRYNVVILHATASDFLIEIRIASCRQNKIKGTFLSLLNFDAIEKDNYLLFFLCKFYLF